MSALAVTLRALRRGGWVWLAVAVLMLMLCARAAVEASKTLSDDDRSARLDQLETRMDAVMSQTILLYGRRVRGLEAAKDRPAE